MDKGVTKALPFHFMDSNLAQELCVRSFPNAWCRGFSLDELKSFPLDLKQIDENEGHLDSMFIHVDVKSEGQFLYNYTRIFLPPPLE